MSLINGQSFLTKINYMYTDPAKKKVELPVDNTEDLFNEAERTEHSGDDLSLKAIPKQLTKQALKMSLSLVAGIDILPYRKA